MAMELYLGMVRSIQFRQYMLHANRRLVSMRETALAVLGDVWGLRKALLEGRKYLSFSSSSTTEHDGEPKPIVEEDSSSPPSSSSHSSNMDVVEAYVAAWTVALVYPNDGLIFSGGGSGEITQLFPAANREDIGNFLKSTTQRESALIQSSCLKKRDVQKKPTQQGGKQHQQHNHHHQPKLDAAASLVPDINDQDAVVERADMGLLMKGMQARIQRRYAIPESLLHNFQSFNEPSGLFPPWMVEEEIVKRQAEEKRLRKWDANKLKKSRIVRRPKV